jgi:tRNA(Ile)-lysidine synthase
MQEVIFPELSECNTVAVAVSGGADSMALVHMLNTYARVRAKKLHIHALTVDHAMRPESGDEAAQVGRWLTKYDHVTHEVLTWHAPKPKTGKMEAARQARYALMATYCEKHKIKMLAVGHHADDQAETFLMRLSHGSGLDGLVGIKKVSAYNNALNLYRPLLMMQHAELIKYCKTNKIKWVEDPTNQNPAYTRTRLRDVLAQEGWDNKRLNVTLQRLERASKALAQMANSISQQAQLECTENTQTYDLKKLKHEPFEITLRIIRTALENLGTQPYGPRLEKLEEVTYTLLNSPRKTKATLGGCVLEVAPRANYLKITRELVFKS